MLGDIGVFVVRAVLERIKSSEINFTLLTTFKSMEISRAEFPNLLKEIIKKKLLIKPACQNCSCLLLYSNEIMVRDVVEWLYRIIRPTP